MATYDDIRSSLCENIWYLSESELVQKLQSIQIDPEVLATTAENGLTLLHIAAGSGRSREFCKVLIDLDPTLLKALSHWGCLPVHRACGTGNMETAMYLLEIYPESINIATTHGDYPLHLLLNTGLRLGLRNNETVVLFEFLVKHDAGAVYSPDCDGNIPLYYACRYGNHSLHLVKPLFDAYPDGILIRNKQGYTPLDHVRSYSIMMPKLLHFFESQVEIVNQAIEDPRSIHRAFQSDIVSPSLGAIKLAVKPVTTAADSQGYTLLHLACLEGDLDTAKCLVELDKESLKTSDANGNLALHHACLRGWCDIIIFLLGESNHGVTVRNSEKKVPIEMLLYEAKCDRNSVEFVAAVDLLLRSCPDTLLYIST
eukprot:scaffold13870_cov77-Cyclotella_meneghiniana.AAC.3